MARKYSTRASTPKTPLVDDPNRSKTAAASSKNYTCGECSKLLGKGNSVGCDGDCNKWFHAVCVGITDQVFKDLRSDEHSEWKCNYCLPVVSFGAVGTLDSPGPLTQAISDLRLATESNANPLQEKQCHLPPVDAVTPSEQLKFGESSGAKAVEAWMQVYNEVVRWKRNVFMPPTGKSGKDLIDEMTKLVNAWTSRSSKEPVAMTMLMVMPALLLQKPSKRSKAADHSRVLQKRVDFWKEGKITELLSEGRAIQRRLASGKHHQAHTEKVFVRLMLQGKVSAAMRWIGNNATGILDASEDVMQELIKKHPKAERATQGSLLEGPAVKVEPVIFESIDGTLIQACAKRTGGSAGPSGLDSDGWKRLLCSKQFGKKTGELCDAIALMARRLSTSYVDPGTLKPYTACRLVPLDKKPGVRPVGIGEVLRRIVGKAIMKVVQRDMVSATSPTQVCAGLPGGVEAAVHAVRELYNSPDTEALILVDANNAFNSLNREAALSNIRVVCPELAAYVINSYREPARLFISGSDKEILSEEGVTQGDNSAMGFYACATVPIILTTLGKKEEKTSTTPINQVWYADDAAGGGKIDDLRTWWDDLCSNGPLFGYYPKPSKTWVIVKPEYEECARKTFPELQVTSMGQRYLGSFIGTREGKEKFMEEKVKEWCADLRQLSDIATREPQVAYAAFTYGLSKRWNYVCRTTPGVAEKLKSLEEETRESFVPAIMNRSFSCTDQLRRVISLPPRFGGLGIPNMPEIAEMEYEYSLRATQMLTKAIVDQESQYEEDMEKLHEVKTSITKDRNAMYEDKKKAIVEELSEQGQLMVNLASEKGASSWLTALPLKEFGYTLNKQQFADALALRYNLNLKDCPRTCACGSSNSVNHALICKLGGFVTMRHNWLRDSVASVMKTAKCKDIQIEPLLLPTNGLQLPAGTITGDQARLDVSARSVWNVLERAFFDIRVFHAPAPTNAAHAIPKMYLVHEGEKKRKYNARVLEVEKGTFTPLVFSTSGGMGTEAHRLVKRLAQRMEIATGQRYSDSVSFIRKRLRFELLKTTVIALRGDRGSKARSLNETPIGELDLNLEPFG